MKSTILAILVLALTGTAHAEGYHQLRVTAQSNGATEQHTFYQSAQTGGLLRNIAALPSGWVCTADFQSKQDDSFQVSCWPLAALKGGETLESIVVAQGSCSDHDTAVVHVNGVSISARCE